MKSAFGGLHGLYTQDMGRGVKGVRNDRMYHN